MDEPTQRAPAFQFYPKDFLTDENVRMMSLQERGAYITLIAMCWIEGTLPADVASLARLCATPLGTFRKLWPALASCFQSDPAQEGRLIHPRLELERAKQSMFRRRQSDAGKRRWNSHGIATAKPRLNQTDAGDSKPAVPPQCSAISTLQSSSAKKKDPPPKTAFDGSRLKVWTWQHEDLARRLGAKPFDLLGWYVSVNGELERSGESYADPWQFLLARFYQDAGIEQPNLMGKAGTRTTALARATSEFLQS